MSEAEAGERDDFVAYLTESQGRLFAYIYSLTADAEMAKDVLQETNRLLWKKADAYDPQRPFLPWALRHAYNQIRAARTRSARERLVFEEEETLQLLAEDARFRENGPATNRAAALENCLLELTEDQRKAVHCYYDRGESLEEIALSLRRRANTVAVMLHRIRQSLADCIRRTLHAPSPDPEPNVRP